MINKITISILLCFFSTLSLADESMDLDRLTSECINAAKGHRTIQKDFPYKVLHTVHYKGWSGGPDTLKLTYPVMMKIRFYGTLKEGCYWFQSNPQKKIKVTARSDVEGNFELIEKTGDEFNNYRFRGVMKDGVIKGLWEKGNGKKAYAFYLKAIEETDNQ